MVLEIADVVSAAEYRKFEDTHKDEVFYTTHTLITYVFNIFSVFIKMAKILQLIGNSKLIIQLIQKDYKLR